MSIEFRIVGQPGHDNAVFARVNTGQGIHRLLFDCGEGCVGELAVSETQAIDHLLFSHLHMDHVGGFDSLFRLTFNRERPMYVWGPPETRRIMAHRFQGFMWNLVEGQPGAWIVSDIEPDHVASSVYLAREAFSVAHDVAEVSDREQRANTQQRTPPNIIATADYTITALAMDHLTPSLAYILRERPRLNVATEKLAALGVRPGPWLRALKEQTPDETPTVKVDGSGYDLAALRAELLVETPGDSLAYLTDFRLDEIAMARLVPALAACQTVICESQYRQADLDLAKRNHHMTATQAAELAKRAQVGQLILFHLSDRYHDDHWQGTLAEAQAIFPATRLHMDVASG